MAESPSPSLESFVSTKGSHVFLLSIPLAILLMTLLHPSSLTHPVKPRQSPAFPKQKTFVLTILLPDVTPLMTVSHSELNQHPHPHTPLLAFLPSASLLIVQVSSTKFPNLSLQHQINLWEGRQLLCFVQCHTLSGTR